MKQKYFTILMLFLCFFLFCMSFSPVIAETEVDAEPIGMEPYEYYTYPEMTALLGSLAANNSDIMQVESLGKTHEGRDIWLVKLSDNVAVDEDEPEVLFMGAHHGNERPSFEVCIYFIEYMVERQGMANFDDDGDGSVNEDMFDGVDNDGDGLVDEDPSEDRVREMLNCTEIYVIPMVNPDGVALNRRKNHAPNYGPDGTSSYVTSYGVDLNRNYGYRWYFPNLFPEEYHLEWLIDDSSGVYRGEAPFCENESRAVKEFVESHDVQISLSYHDWGEWMIFPWMHSSRWTPHELLFRDIGYGIAEINKYELRIFGQVGTQEYLFPRYCGTPGSSENWLYGEHEIIAYTVELCERRPETNPVEVLNACWKHVGVNLYVCQRAQTVELEKEQRLVLPQLRLLLELL